MSDHDPRVRELTYRLMEMAPDAPPFPEEITMTVPETKQRPPMLVWATAAVAVVLLVGLPLFLFRGGDGTGDPATTIAAPVTTTTVQEPTTTTVSPPTTLGPSTTRITLPVTTSGDCRQDYEDLGGWDGGTIYVFFGCDRPGMEDLLVPRPRVVYQGNADALGHAMIEQLTGPTEEEKAAGYFAFTTDGDAEQYVGYRLDDLTSGVRFDFKDFRFDAGMANASASTASTQLLEQLSSVVFQFSVVTEAEYTFGGDCDLFWNWLQRDCTQLLYADWGESELGDRIRAWQDLSSTTSPTTTIPSSDSTTTSLPGEAFDIGPAAGDIVAVVGVHFGDVLNVRMGPGTGYEIVTTLEPLAADVIATGRHRLLQSSIWDEVTAAGVTGWVNSRFIGYLGLTDDLTAFVVRQLGGIPEAETMVALGDIVAESFRSDEGGFRYTVSIAPAVGDLGEIGYDVLGLADDAQLGWRLHIFGQPTAGGEGFSLKSVEATAICGRGVTDEGLCV